MKAVASIKLDDAKAEQVRQSHAVAITDLQKSPAMELKSLGDVQLPNGTSVAIPHGLGRTPAFVFLSPVRNSSTTTAGQIQDVRTGIDTTQYIQLQANGYGSTITVTVAVM